MKARIFLVVLFVIVSTTKVVSAHPNIDNIQTKATLQDGIHQSATPTWRYAVCRHILIFRLLHLLVHD